MIQVFVSCAALIVQGVDVVDTKPSGPSFPALHASESEAGTGMLDAYVIQRPQVVFKSWPSYRPDPSVEMPEIMPLPSITPVDDAGTADPELAQANQIEVHRGAQFRAVFLKAARFEGFEMGPVVMEPTGERALIYEGMSLTVRTENGAYEAQYVIETPNTPVTVRLRFRFCDNSDVTRHCELTLPPATIVPRGRTDAQRATLMWTVRQVGYVPQFDARINPDSTWCQRPHCIGVSRDGTAQFGSRPAR